MQSQNKEFNHASCEEDLGNAALRKSEEEASFVQLPKRVYSMDACPKQEAMIKMPSDVSQHVRENALNYLGERLHRIILLHHKKTPEGYPEILDRCRYFYVVLTDRFAVRGYRRHSSETLVKEVNLFQYGNCEVCVMTPATFKVKWEAREFPYYSETFLELYRKVDFRKEAVQVMARPPEGKREFPSKAHEQTYTQLLDSGRYFFSKERVQDQERHGLRARTNRLVVGPSATGKSFLARQVAKELDAHLCEVSLGNWIPRGADAKPCTMVVILEALLAHPRVVLMIDEIDKAVSLENSKGWSVSNRNDVYALLDRQVGFENLIELLKDPELKKMGVRAAAGKLRELMDNNLYIIACGTWQKLYKARRGLSRSVGFGSREGADESSNDVSLSEGGLKNNDYIADELRNRFHSDILELRPLTRREGIRMAELLGVMQLAKELKMPEKVAEIDWANNGMRELESVFTSLKTEQLKQSRGGTL